MPDKSVKSYRVNVHFLAPNAQGPAVGVRINHTEQTIEKFAQGPACMAGAKTWPAHQTAEADAVTCPKCKATPVWKAAMIALLTERCVPDDDPAWEAVGGAPAAPVEAPVPQVVASTPIVTPPPPPSPPDPGPLTQPHATPATPPENVAAVTAAAAK
jgi:hypothetical protein